MDNFLTKLLGITPSVNSAEQLAQAQRKTYSASLERQARRRGFRSAEEMVLTAERRSRPAIGKSYSSGPAMASPSLKTAMAWHPANILSYVMGKIDSATK